MNNIIFILAFTLIHGLISAQCYIQYTYDASGNRIERKYVGGCDRPVVKGTQAEMKPDTIQMTETETRTERIRQDMDGQITLFPNPTEGLFTIRLDKYEPTWVYKLTSLSGQLLQQSLVTGPQVILDIGSMPASPYLFVINDSAGQIIYKTKIIKQ
jgi:hypothetical protein